MYLIRRICSAAAALTVFASVLTAVPRAEADAATTVTVSPYDVYEINGGKFEGWGTSLCWWANRVGYSDTLAQLAADTFFSPDGLGLNIARFNIGGGDDPSHTHITRTDSNMPGYTKYNNGSVTYDWSADANQRNVLQRCIKAAGDDMIVEMFSNSPPYYMTNSGCSSGAVKSSENNLRSDKYTDFAEYLAEVTAHYEKDWGIHVQSITPMNEPYTDYWGAYSNKQEGCHFDQDGFRRNDFLRWLTQHNPDYEVDDTQTFTPDEGYYWGEDVKIKYQSKTYVGRFEEYETMSAKGQIVDYGTMKGKLAAIL